MKKETFFFFPFLSLFLEKERNFENTKDKTSFIDPTTPNFLDSNKIHVTFSNESLEISIG